MVPRLSITLSIMILLGLLIMCCDLLVPGMSHSFTTVKLKEEMKSPLAQPLVSDKSVPISSRKLKSKKSVQTGVDKGLSAKTKKPSTSERASKKSSRHEKPTLNTQLPVSIQLQSNIKMNLAHHGMLERSHRYDPGHDRRAGRMISPLAGELQRDHFTELDRNHDGAIDPFERAFGRLDLDRDLHSRQWE